MVQHPARSPGGGERGQEILGERLAARYQQAPRKAPRPVLLSEQGAQVAGRGLVQVQSVFALIGGELAGIARHVLRYEVQFRRGEQRAEQNGVTQVGGEGGQDAKPLAPQPAPEERERGGEVVIEGGKGHRDGFRLPGRARGLDEIGGPSGAAGGGGDMNSVIRYGDFGVPVSADDGRGGRDPGGQLAGP